MVYTLDGMMAKSKRTAITGFGVVLLLILVFAIYFYMTSKTVVVSGVSMLPTFKNGQRVFVSKAYWLIGGINDRDVVVVRDDSPLNKDGYIIKRIYKQEGELVDSVNQPRDRSFAEGPYRVPEGKVYVLGDNREQSEDSRSFGPVERSKILGKVIVWP